MKKLTLIYLSLFCSPLAQASALYFYEIGTEDTALAGAGQAARAQDASTIVTNPAGMTRLPDHMFTGGLQAMDGDVSYTLEDETGRKSPGDIMRFFPNASAFYAQKVNDDLYAGIGLYGNYGLGIDFGNWSGDRLIKKSTMVAMTLSPSLAYKLSDRVSVGGSDDHKTSDSAFIYVSAYNVYYVKCNLIRTQLNPHVAHVWPLTSSAHYNHESPRNRVRSCS